MQSVKVGQFWIDGVGAVYEVVSVLKGSILVHHTWKNQAWEYSSVHDFMSEMKTLITGKRHKRTEILADVIKQLDAKKFIPQPGIYCDLYYSNDYLTYDNLNSNDNAKTLIQKDEITCNVCALGSLFIASVDVYNKLDTIDLLSFDANNMIDHLSEYFSEKELCLIEWAFEGHNVQYHSDNTLKMIEIIIQFRRKVKRKENILYHIIANTIKYGSFKPEFGLA